MFNRWRCMLWIISLSVPFPHSSLPTTLILFSSVTRTLFQYSAGFLQKSNSAFLFSSATSCMDFEVNRLHFELRQFFYCMVGYHRGFCQNFATVEELPFGFTVIDCAICMVAQLSKSYRKCQNVIVIIRLLF